MKKFVFAIFLTITSTSGLFAQSEQPQIIIEQEGERMATYKEYEGFILDLTETLATPAILPKFELLNYSKDPYINWLDRLNLNLGNVTYGRTNYSPDMIHSQWNRYSMRTQGINDPINTATFRLNDNWKLSTYGDYDADGYKRANPAQLPWQKNDFKGGFELKSSKGFSFKMEMRRTANPHELYW